MPHGHGGKTAPKLNPLFGLFAGNGYAVFKLDDNDALDGVMVLVDAEGAGNARKVSGAFKRGFYGFAGKLACLCGAGNGINGELRKVIAQRVERIRVLAIFGIEVADELEHARVLVERGVVVGVVNVVERVGTGKLNKRGGIVAVRPDDGAVDAKCPGLLDDKARLLIICGEQNYVEVEVLDLGEDSAEVGIVGVEGFLGRNGAARRSERGCEARGDALTIIVGDVF